jgi:hypothetical protein
MRRRIALAAEACARGYKVRFYRATELVTTLIEARDERSFLRLKTQLAKLDLLVLDEQGYVPASKVGAELLFDVISTAYERTSMIVTTNLPFESWTEVLGSERLTGATLDRLTHRCRIIETKGESYRLHDAKKRNQPRPNPDQTLTQPTSPNDGSFTGKTTTRQTDNQPTCCRFRRSRAVVFEDRSQPATTNRRTAARVRDRRRPRPSSAPRPARRAHSRVQDRGVIKGESGFRHPHVEGEQVIFGILEQRGDLRHCRGEACDHLADPLGGLLARVGVEDLAQRSGDESALCGAAVLVHVADEMDRATLPRAGEHPRDRVAQPLVLIGDAEAHEATATVSRRAMHPLGNQRGLSPTTYRSPTNQRPTSHGRQNDAPEDKRERRCGKRDEDGRHPGGAGEPPTAGPSNAPATAPARCRSPRHAAPAAPARAAQATGPRERAADPLRQPGREDHGGAVCDAERHPRRAKEQKAAERSRLRGDARAAAAWHRTE